MHKTIKIFDCIVIGAGPGGIVSTKELLENGISNILCLEQADKLGGVFSKSYDNLQLTSSATFSMFSDFYNKMDEDNHFWSKKEAVDYWRRYAEHFNVLDHIKFNTKVNQVVRLDDGNWQLTLNEQEKLCCKKLVLATGNNCTESYPTWIEKLTKVKYSHSKHYQNAKPFVGKRVLVVGGGESASDIALEISRVAEKCWVSLRDSTGWVIPRKRGTTATDISTHRGIWGLPRKKGQELSAKLLEMEKAHNNSISNAVVMLNKKITTSHGIWGTYGTKTFALAEAIAHHNCQVVGEVTNVTNGGHQLTTADNIELANVDIVVFSTGYINSITFMPEELQQCDPRALYKHMFHPKLQDKLAWIGWARPGFGSQFPIMELQARLFARVCANQHTLPNSATIEQVIEQDYQENIMQFEHNAKRIRSLVDYFRYMDGLADEIGCKPPLVKYFFCYPLLWLQLMYGPNQATQYRLTGPGRKVKLAHKILKLLPISPFNNLVKIGLRMRLAHAKELLFKKTVS